MFVNYLKEDIKMVCLKCGSDIDGQKPEILYKEDAIIKVIADTKVADQNKYNEWFKGQFSVWDV